MLVVLMRSARQRLNHEFRRRLIRAADIQIDHINTLLGQLAHPLIDDSEGIGGKTGESVGWLRHGNLYIR
jgi:hypothetical protein